jgi:hypothetical protein
MRLARGERAQGLVEFALVLPLFLVLILATVDFGWALRAYITATNSAREGARVGAVGENEAGVVGKVVSTSSGLLSSANVTVTGEQGAPGTSVRVDVDYDYDYITPLGSLVSMLTGGTLPSPLPINTSATMRIE